MSAVDMEGVSITSYKVAKPWYNSAWTDDPDSSNVGTSAFHRSDTKQLHMPFYEIEGTAISPVSPSVVVTLLEENLKYV